MDRNEAINELIQCYDLYDRFKTAKKTNKAISMAIEALEQASTWIPVTPDTMPPNDEEVEVTILDDSGDSPFRYTTVGWHYNGLWIANNERCFDVVAWKPLSEPWEGE